MKAMRPTPTKAKEPPDQAIAAMVRAETGLAPSSRHTVGSRWLNGLRGLLSTVVIAVMMEMLMMTPDAGFGAQVDLL